MAAARPLPSALRIIAGERNRAADSALLEALPHLDAAARAVALDALLKRGHAPTLSQLVSRFHGYTAEIREEIVRRAGGLQGAIREVIGSEVFEDRAAAIGLIVSGDEAALAYLLADALTSTCARTRELAAGGLHGMTDRLNHRFETALASGGTAAWSARADALAEGVRTAVLHWERHYQPKVLEAALWLGDRVHSTLVGKLKDPHSRITRTLCELLERSDDPRFGGAVLRSLAVPALRTSAARALLRASDPGFIGSVVREGWLFGDEGVDDALRWIPCGAWLGEWWNKIPNADDRESERFVRIAIGAGGTPERTIEQFQRLISSTHETVRRAAFWRLVEEPADWSTDLLRLMAARSGDALAGLAQRECRRRVTVPASGRAFERRRRGEPRQAAESLFGDYVADFDRLSRPQREHRGRAVRANTPGLNDRIRAMLSSPEPLDQCRGLKIAAQLGSLNELRIEVYRMVNDPNRGVRAAAVSALAELPGPTTHRILRNAVHDPDERVQANAIESADRLDVPDRAGYIREKLQSANPRVRANAVKTLLRLEVREAGEALLDMLEDRSQAHRASALWVIERLHLTTVLPRVHEISRSDPDHRIRQRARHVHTSMTRRALRPARGAGSAASHGDPA